MNNERIRNTWGEFIQFVQRGNVLDMAVGIAVGTAFTAIVRSLVDDIIMPPIGLILGRMDFSNLFVVLRAGDPVGPYTTLANAQNAGAVILRYGQFVNTVISFFIIALAVFFLIRAISRVLPKPEVAPAPTTKECAYCHMEIPLGATRCPFCTTHLAEA
ncbi:MAG TPA: large conductance mechanosensitive channel protein MscL [Chloroflexi bacterium]|jgi:large conductance mechanosensitive channel|nr:large conductance mechanosensitive channel protein MscL [Chloroflexota bacterium]